MNSILFSSKSDEWETPSEVFEKLNEEFGFTLDPCANANNHKCSKYFTKELDGLNKNWGGKLYSVTRPTAKLVLG